MYSAYKLNKQGDSIQPWRIPFPVWNQSIVPCPVLIVAFWPACRFLRRQVRLSDIPISWRMFQFAVIHTVKGFGIVNEAEVDVFLELSCFFYDPTDVGNLISGSSDFSKSNLNIWKFMVNVLLKPSLKNFEYWFTTVWNECNCVVVWTFFDIAFLWGLEWKLTFSSPVVPAEFLQLCWHIECSTLTASSYRILNSSTGIPPPPLALLVVMLPKAHLSAHSRKSELINSTWL